MALGCYPASIAQAISLQRGLAPNDAPLAAGIVELFPARSRLIVHGEHVFGYRDLPVERPGDVRVQLLWLQDGRLLETELIVSVPLEPWRFERSGQVLVADAATDALWVVHADGTVRDVGTPNDHIPYGFRATASGLFVVAADRRTRRGEQRHCVLLYDADGAELGAVEHDRHVAEVAVFEGPSEDRCAVALLNHDCLRLIGVRYAQREVEAFDLARFDDVEACFAFVALDIDATRVRWPKGHRVSESGVEAAILGLDSALANLDQFPRLVISEGATLLRG